MKYCMWISFTCLLLLVQTGCRDKNCGHRSVSIYEAGDIQNGWLNASKNCKSFTASGAMGYMPSVNNPHNLCWLTFQTFENDNGNLLTREGYYLSYIPLMLGTYKAIKDDGNIQLNTLAGGYETYREDGDVIGDVYDVDNDADNFLSIESIDTITHIVKGTLAITYTIKSKQKGSKNPDKIYISDGKFEVKIK